MLKAASAMAPRWRLGDVRPCYDRLSSDTVTRKKMFCMNFRFCLEIEIENCYMYVLLAYWEKRETIWETICIDLVNIDEHFPRSPDRSIVLGTWVGTWGPASYRGDLMSNVELKL